MAGAGRVAEDEGEGDDHAFDEEYETPALGGRRKGSPRRNLRSIESKVIHVNPDQL